MVLEVTLIGADAGRRLFLVALSVLAGLIVAMAFHSSVADSGGLWPQNSFLFAPRDRYGDLLNSTAKMVHNNPYFEESIGVPAYFPFAYLALRPLAALPPRLQVEVYLAMSVLFWILAAGVAFSRSRPTTDAAAGMLLLSLLSVLCYPFIFGADRGNLDTIIGGLSFLSILLLHHRRPWVAAVFLSVAIAFKGYPLLLLALFFAAREGRAAALALALALACSIGALLSFQGDIQTNITGFVAGLQGLHDEYTIGTKSMHYSSDVYNAVRAFIVFRDGPQAWSPLYSVFSPLNLILVSGAFVVAAMPRFSFHTRVFFAVLAALLFPGVINDYKLVLVVPVVWAFSTSEHKWHLEDRLVFGMLALLLVPKAYFMLFADVSISCFINPALLFGALLLMLGRVFREVSRQDQPAQPA